MKNSKVSIRKIVGYLNEAEADGGGFWLPNIQRNFVWNQEQIEKLFDSIMRGYPISTLLTWRTRSKIRRREFIKNYRTSLKMTDFYLPEDEKVKTLVLDGQQRLQSFFIALKGSYEGKELYFDVLSGEINLPEDIKYKFKFMENAKLPWVKLKEIVFSPEQFDEISETLIENFEASVTFERDLTKEEKRRIRANISRIVKVFQVEENLVYQEIDSVDNPEMYTEEDIVEIFIRANSGGTVLGKSDLLFSLLTVSWDEAEEQLQEILDDLNRSGYKFNRDFILKSCLTLLGKGASYDVSKFRDESTRQNIISNWDKIANAIKAVKDYLYEKTFIRSDKALPSYLCLIPLIYFRYHYQDKWKKAEGIDDYILRTLLAGSFSGTPDNLINQCTKSIDANQNFSVKAISDIIRENGRNLEITKETILEQYYGAKNIHLIFNMWYKGFNYHPSFAGNEPQVDHIFPQSLLKSVKERNPKSEAMNILKYKQWERDQIANLMLLTQEENSFSGKCDTPPEKWFADKPDEYLELHLIPKDKELWKLDNFRDFIEERKKLIEQKFDYLILKK